MKQISATDLTAALLAMTRTAEILKQRFPNLTVNETNLIAKDIVYAIMSVTE